MKISTIMTAALLLTATLLQGCSAVSGKSGGARKAAEYHAQLGIGYLQRNRLVLAKEYLDKAIKHNKNSPTAQHYYALLQERLGNDKLAGEYFSKAMRKDAENPELLNNYGSFLCKVGALEKAQSAFMAAAKNPLYKTPEFAYTNAGICLKRKGEATQAEAYLRKALSLRADFPSALFHMAELSHQQNENAKAQAFLYRYTEHIPDTPETLLLCYNINVDLRDDVAAQKCADQLLAKFPRSNEASKLN